MAKHIKNTKAGSHISKGLRTSCKPLVKRPAAIIEQASRVGTAMREALLNIKIDPSAVGGKIVGAILNSGKQNAGNKPVGRGWTANLSARTVQELTKQGVFG